MFCVLDEPFRNFKYFFSISYERVLILSKKRYRNARNIFYKYKSVFYKYIILLIAIIFEIKLIISTNALRL